MSTSFIGRTDLPRGLRDNNPGNIRPSTKYTWNGQTGVENGYCIFIDMEHGLRAMAIDLRSKINRGLNTISKYIPVYSPNGDGANNEAAYIKSVCDDTGFSATQILIADKDTLKKLVHAHIEVEVGIKKAFNVTETMINDGINLI